MSRELIVLAVYGLLPAVATVVWWLAALVRKLKKQPALGPMGQRLAVVHIALLSPGVTVALFYGLNAAGVSRPWEQVTGAPVAAIFWLVAYAFVLTSMFGGAAEEGTMARRLKLAERRMELYHRIGSVTEAPLKPRAALYVMLEQLMQEFDMQVGMIHLANEHGELSLVTYRNIDSLAAGVLGFIHSGDGLLGQVHSTGTATQASPEDGLAPGGRELRLGPGVDRVVAVPLRANGATLGVLTLGRKGKEKFPQDDVESLTMVAAQIGAFVEGRGLAQREAGDVDIAFTRGFVDPHEFVRVMETEMSRARRYERPLVIASVEVAGYDREGDLEAAQTAIGTVADVIRRNLRMADYCAYHDRGRFSLLLPETDVEGCRALGSRLAERITEAEDLFGVRLGVRMMMASYPEHADTIDELLQALQDAQPLTLVSANGHEEHGTARGAWPEPPAGWREDSGRGDLRPGGVLPPSGEGDGEPWQPQEWSANEDAAAGWAQGSGWPRAGMEMPRRFDGDPVSPGPWGADPEADAGPQAAWAEQDDDARRAPWETAEAEPAEEGGGYGASGHTGAGSAWTGPQAAHTWEGQPWQAGEPEEAAHGETAFDVDGTRVRGSWPGYGSAEDEAPAAPWAQGPEDGGDAAAWANGNGYEADSNEYPADGYPAEAYGDEEQEAQPLAGPWADESPADEYDDEAAYEDEGSEDALEASESQDEAAVALDGPPPLEGGRGAPDALWPFAPGMPVPGFRSSDYEERSA